jgi:hypothetical protein
MRRAGRRSGGEDLLRPRLVSPSSRLVGCTRSYRVPAAPRLRQPLSRASWLDRLALPSAGCLGGPGRAGPPIVPS